MTATSDSPQVVWLQPGPVLIPSTLATELTFLAPVNLFSLPDFIACDTGPGTKGYACHATALPLPSLTFTTRPNKLLMTLPGK